MTVAADAYETSLRQRGLAGVTVQRARDHLNKLLRLGKHGHRPLSWLTSKRAESLYLEMRTTNTKKGEPPAVDNHRNALAAARSFGRFCAEHGWIKADPFAKVKGVGRRKRGKPQLHVTETYRLVAACYSENSRESIAVAASVLMGMGPSEVAHRQVRDLDMDGQLLHVTKGKNDFRVRTIEVPEDLRPFLLALAGKRPGAAYLFGSADLERPSRYWVHYHCTRLCKTAGVPHVSPHGLRGTHSTIAVGFVSTSHSVSAAVSAAGQSLGHAPGSPITASTYVAPGTIEQAKQRAVMRVLSGGVGNFPAVGVTSTDPTSEKPSANGGTRTPTVLPTGT